MRRVFVDPSVEEAFWRDGYVVAPLLGPDEVEAMAELYARFADRHPPGFSPTILNQDLEYRAAVDREVARVLGSALGPLLDRYHLFHCGFAVKTAASPSAVPLHRDLSVVDEEQAASLTLLAPLVDLTEENGWLGVVAGSHRLAPGPRAPGDFPYRALEEAVHARHLRWLPLRAGEVLLMHPATFHASPPNRTAAPRVMAAGMAAPEEVPLHFCHRDLAADGPVEMFAVDAGFFLRHRFGTRPDAGAPIRTVPYDPVPLDESDLERARAAAQAA